jgi:hypothetical protein
MVRVFLRFSLAEASSEQGVFFQDPLKQDVSRGGTLGAETSLIFPLSTQRTQKKSLFILDSLDQKFGQSL